MARSKIDPNVALRPDSFTDETRPNGWYVRSKGPSANWMTHWDGTKWSGAQATPANLVQRWEEEVLPGLEDRDGGTRTRDPNAYLLRDCKMLGGFGHEIKAGSTCNLMFDVDQIAIHGNSESEDGSALLVAPYCADTKLEVGGPGKRQTGGGFIGGGFGPTGAAEGMVAASLLNALTRRTEIETIVSVTNPDWRVIVHSDSISPEQLQIKLAPAFGAIEKHQRSAAKPTADDPVQRLKELSSLHEAGALTDDEFAKAKEKVIGSL